MNHWSNLNWILPFCRFGRSSELVPMGTANRICSNPKWKSITRLKLFYYHQHIICNMAVINRLNGPCFDLTWVKMPPINGRMESIIVLPGGGGALKSGVKNQMVWYNIIIININKLRKYLSDYWYSTSFNLLEKKDLKLLAP